MAPQTRRLYGTTTGPLKAAIGRRSQVARTADVGLDRRRSLEVLL
jgi:hypothetical protein